MLRFGSKQPLQKQSLSTWLIRTSYSVVALWNVCFLSVWSSPSLTVLLWTALSEIYIRFLQLFACGWKYIKIKSYTCWKRHENKTFYDLTLTLLGKILNESSCNFFVVVENPPRIYSGKFLILIYCPEMFSTNQNAGFPKLQYSRNNSAMKLILFL